MRTAVSDFINAFASSCSDLLTKALRKRVVLQVTSIGACQISDLTDDVLTSPAALLHGSGCSLAIVLERQLSFSILDTLLGGDGKAAVRNGHQGFRIVKPGNAGYKEQAQDIGLLFF